MFECSTAFFKASQIKRDESDFQSLIKVKNRKNICSTCCKFRFNPQI